MTTKAILSRRRVLHFMRTWLPLSETFVYGLVTNSRHRGVVVSSERIENAHAFPYSPLVSLRRFPAPQRYRRQVVSTSLTLLALRHSVGLIHVHHGYRLHEVLAPCRRLGLPLVVSVHGHDVTGFPEQNPQRYPQSVKVVDAVIVPSQFLAGVAADVGFPGDRIHIIPSGVDTAQFTPTPLPSGPPEVLFVGRFVEKKGLDMLLAAWPAVRRQVPEARLRVLGFGPLESLARSGGESVEVVVQPDHQQVRDAMRRAYVVVTPSRTAPDDAVESLLIVNLEAQASGRPVVTTHHGAIPEFVSEGETALVVPENDVDALATGLTEVLLNPELANRLAHAGPRWVEQFDVRRCTERVDVLYDSLLAGSGRRARVSRY